MNKFFKRLFDIAASASGLIVLSPVFLILAYLIRKNLGSPVFFIQERPGKDGKPFKMIKFRSMRDALDSDGIPLPDSERLTDFGKKLRAASLDELPELWNVLKGEMSLVGPRPLLMQYLPLYDEFQNRRHEMKPGITGWAQVNGRNALSWDEKFACDVWYIDHYSFWLDMGESVKIIDLARQMITLSGLKPKTPEQPDGDIEILITGLRPGEKLYEELLIGDNVRQTAHPRIMTADEAMLPWHELLPILNRLRTACDRYDQQAIRDLLVNAPTGFSPTGGICDLLWVRETHRKNAV